MRKFTKIIFTVSLFSFIFISGCFRGLNYFPEIPRTYILKNQSYRFLQRGSRGSFEIIMNIDGTYSEYPTYGSDIVDKGMWKQDSDGMIVLISDMGRCAGIISKPFIVYVSTIESITHVVEIRENIEILLRDWADDRPHTMRAEDFCEQVGGGLSYGISYGSVTRVNCVSKSDIYNLKESIDTFLNEPESRHRKLFPLLYRRRVHLLDVNSTSSAKQYYKYKDFERYLNDPEFSKEYTKIDYIDGASVERYTEGVYVHPAWPKQE